MRDLLKSSDDLYAGVKLSVLRTSQWNLVCIHASQPASRHACKKTPVVARSIGAVTMPKGVATNMSRMSVNARKALHSRRQTPCGSTAAWTKKAMTPYLVLFFYMYFYVLRDGGRLPNIYIYKP